MDILIVDLNSSSSQDIQWIQEFFHQQFHKIQATDHDRHIRTIPNEIVCSGKITREEFLVHICCHLLGIVQNITPIFENVHPLISHNQLEPLLGLFNSGSLRTPSLIPITRQLIRTYIVLIDRFCASQDNITVLRGQGIVSSLLEILATMQHASGIVCLELCQLVVYIVYKSAQVCPDLFIEFRKAEGYQIVTLNLIWVSKNGSYNEIVCEFRLLIYE
jgi:hypothetical protein